MVKVPTYGTENFPKMILNFSRLMQEEEEIENKIFCDWDLVKSRLRISQRSDDREDAKSKPTEATV